MISRVVNKRYNERVAHHSCNLFFIYIHMDDVGAQRSCGQHASRTNFTNSDMVNLMVEARHVGLE